jgi:WD40 repeat protein
MTYRSYSSGEVLIFDYMNKSVIVRPLPFPHSPHSPQATLRGHRSAVLSLAYDESGTLLASGGADSDIFIWDMVTLAGKHPPSIPLSLLLPPPSTSQGNTNSGATKTP